VGIHGNGATSDLRFIRPYSSTRVDHKSNDLETQMLANVRMAAGEWRCNVPVELSGLDGLGERNLKTVYWI